MKIKKKLLIFFIFDFIIVSCLVIIFNKDRIIKSIIINQAQKIIGAPISINNLSLNLSKRRLEIKGLRIHNPAGFAEGLLLDIPEITADYNLSGILKRKLRLNSLVINLKEVGVVKNTQGQINLDALKISNKKENNVKQKSVPIALQIDMLKLSIAIVTYKDYSHKNGPAVQLFNINIKDRIYKDINGVGDLVTLLLKESIKRTTIRRGVMQSAAIYGVKAVASRWLLPAEIGVILVGKDSASSDFSFDFNTVYDRALEVVARCGKIVSQNKNKGLIKAKIYADDIEIRITSLAKKLTKIVVSARKEIIPRPLIAEEILYEISEKFE